MLGAVEVLFTICKDVVPLVIKSTLHPPTPQKGEKSAHFIRTLLGHSPCQSHSIQTDRVGSLVIYWHPHQLAGRPLEETEEGIFPAIGHRESAVQELVPREPLGRVPVGDAVIVSRGKCWVFLTSVAIHSSSPGTLSKASLKICSFIHRFLFIMRTY